MSRAPRSPNPPDRGFTLVEMLVSLAILSVVAVLIAQALQGHGRALNAVERHTLSGEEIAFAQNALRDRVEHLFPHAIFTSGAPTVDFDGRADSMEMVALVKAPGHLPQVRRVRLDVSSSGELLMADSAPDGPPRFGQGQILLSGVKAAQFSYYGAPRGAGAATGWQDHWSGATAPPRLVRIQIGFADDDRRQWPEFLARPAATVDDACVLDPQTGDCRGRS